MTCALDHRQKAHPDNRDRRDLLDHMSCCSPDRDQRPGRWRTLGHSRQQRCLDVVDIRRRSC